MTLLLQTEPPRPEGPALKLSNMKRRPLGHTGLHVSELCLGTMSFGWRTRHSTALTLLDEFVEAGGTFLEAAQICPDVLTPPDWAGLPESSIGDWLRSRQHPRESLILATRLVWNPDRHLPSDSLANCCEASLRRLKTDYLDLLVCDWTPTTPQLEDMLHGLTRLVEQGKVRHLAVSSFGAWQTGENLRQNSLRQLAGIGTIQADYSLLDRQSEPQLLGPNAGRLGFIARSPLAGGFLALPNHACQSLQDPRRRRNLHLRYGHSTGQAVCSAVESVAKDLGATMAQVSYSWVLSNPAVSALLIAPLSVNQLHDAIEATDLSLSWPQLRRLDLVSSTYLSPEDIAPALPEPSDRGQVLPWRGNGSDQTDDDTKSGGERVITLDFVEPPVR